MMTNINPTVAVMAAGKQEVEVDRSVEIDKDSQSTMLRIQPIQMSTLGKGIGRAYPAELDEDLPEPTVERSLVKLKNKSV